MFRGFFKSFIFPTSGRYLMTSALKVLLRSIFLRFMLQYIYSKQCWFSVSRHSKQIQMKIKTVQQIKTRIWEIKGDTYTTTLAKIQVRGIFRKRDIRRPVFNTQTYRDFYGDVMLVLTWMSCNMAEGNEKKHLLPSFATKA